MIVNFDSLINLKMNLAKGIAVSAFKASAVFIATFLVSCGEPDDKVENDLNTVNFSHECDLYADVRNELAAFKIGDTLESCDSLKHSSDYCYPSDISYLIRSDRMEKGGYCFYYHIYTNDKNIITSISIQ